MKPARQLRIFHQPRPHQERGRRIAARGVEAVGWGKSAFRWQIEHRVLPAVRAFKPDLILLSAGFDAGNHDVGNDRLDTEDTRSGIDLDADDFQWVTQKVMDVATLTCDGKLVSVLEGGYGRWKKVQKGYTIDRTLLAENCTAHVKALAGL